MPAEPPPIPDNLLDVHLDVLELLHGDGPLDRDQVAERLSHGPVGVTALDQLAGLHLVRIANPATATWTTTAAGRLALVQYGRTPVASGEAVLLAVGPPNQKEFPHE